ncbi:hypothetical protein MYCTH_2303063 [Thermothelomyces thermophilus ATCC 42464]|uniref:Uncharacterized protein n=1 Tax=Thermothelomyces thermophilus (strain ATCC 42464 / BCRC 31852 / DSM 1799) TaxID=573729 RepID=G2Q9A9_THET4|nr:uncharacterized protein MYCTH_2303063 [Thermothelomyces thermophilus ATCC 42464]AEO57201.1 hypothetical protein MYCTH_2303063 [Thermothelomyces thermophilus ATCC 42464]
MMAEPLSDYEAALSAIRQSGLGHPDRPLLESFIDDSVDRGRAAAFLLKRLSRDTTTSKPDIGAFLADWKRTIAMCNIPSQENFHGVGC